MPWWLRLLETIQRWLGWIDDSQEPPSDGKKPDRKPAPQPVGQALLVLHNQARRNAELAQLKLNKKLSAAAAKHAKWMSKHHRLSHEGKRKRTHVERIAKEGYSSQISGENIAMGFTTKEDVFVGWMNSSGHKNNILHPHYREVGFGSAKSKRGERYWVAVFATSASAARIPVTAGLVVPSPGICTPD
jgi:uncharacterized protein YkwD